MKRIDLQSPFPRKEPLKFCEVAYQIESTHYLEIPEVNDTPPLWSCMESRRSRHASGPLCEYNLSRLLWMCAKIQPRLHRDASDLALRRPAPSAGGLYPIDVLVIQEQTSPSVSLYDPISHALCVLRNFDVDGLFDVVRNARDASQYSAGTILLFSANFDRTSSKYENGESLVWRDSGALLSMIYLACEGLGLACRGLGITGEPWISSLTPLHSGRSGVGGCVVGSQRE